MGKSAKNSKKIVPKTNKDEGSEKSAPKNTGGRPSSYSEEIADIICERIATSDKGLNSICQEGTMPNPATVYRWLNSNKEFCERYARAREAQADYMVEQIIKIADDSENDTLMGEHGVYPNGVNVQRSRLMVDARKFIAAKLNPKKYGDKTSVDLTVNKVGKDLADEIYE